MSMNVNNIARQRVTGLMTGMDIDDIVRGMLSRHQNRLDKANQQRELINWRRDAYRGAVNSLTSFQSRFFDVMSSDSIFRPSNFRTQTASLTNEAMSKYFTVTGSEATSGTITVDSISQLASTQKVESTGSIAVGKMEATRDMSQLSNFFGTNQTLNVTINGETQTLTLNLNREDYQVQVREYYNTNVPNPAFVDEDATPDVPTHISNTQTRDAWQWGTDSADNLISSENAEAALKAFAADLEQQINDQILIKFGRLPEGVAGIAGGAKLSVKIDVSAIITSELADFADSTIGSVSHNRQTGSISLSFASASGITASIAGGASASLGISGNSTSNYIDVNTMTLRSISGLNSNAAGEVRFSVNEVEFTFGSNATLREVMDAVNKSEANVTMTYSAHSNKFIITSDRTGSADNVRLKDLNTVQKISSGDNEGKLVSVFSGIGLPANINGTTVQLLRSPGSNIYEYHHADGQIINFMQAGNSLTVAPASREAAAALGIPVTLSMDDVEDSTVSTNFLASIFGGNSTEGIGSVTRGSDAVVSINGETRILAGNDVTVDGISIKLNMVTVGQTDWIPGSGAAAGSDPDRTIEVIKNFIDEYNKLIQDLTNMITERRPRSKNAYFMPLTSSVKAEMSESEIKAWEEEGKKGLLYNDPTITRIIGSLRSAMMSPVTLSDGRRVTLASIGIQPASFLEDRSGALKIDETALRAAIDKDPSMVETLFTQNSPYPKPPSYDGTEGIGRTIDNFPNTGGYLTTERDAVGNLIPDLYGNVVRNISDYRGAIFNTQGLGRRFEDAFASAINVSANEHLRGSLIRTAGTGGANAYIDNTSLLSRQTAQTDSLIDRILKKMQADEDRFYMQFAKLETSLAKLSSQAAYLGIGEE
ncbi:MAG: flagellar filament capping protein FliD [Oscillospiraceae bacterium]|nr:flagellar filament capping protein FliD [Oscillospiraceae bacterium]